MKEVLFKKEYSKYETVEHEPYSPFPYFRKKIKDEILGFDSEVGPVPTKKHPLFIHKKTNDTEEEFVARFADQMYSVHRMHSTVVVERDGDKVAIKLFFGYKHRRPGVVWFRQSKNVQFISVNTKTGDVYVGGIDNYHLKTKARKRIRRNYFFGEPLMMLSSLIRSRVRIHNEEVEIANDAISAFINAIDPNEGFGDLTWNQRLFKFYLTKRGVKFPNNFHIYTSAWFGPEIKKSLKKNGNRMVDAIMDLNKFSGKKIKKALHTCDDLNLRMYEYGRNMFGDDWMNQDEELILKCLNSDILYNPAHEEFLEFVTTEELKRVFKLFKQVIINGTLDGSTFFDHIRFYTDLKLYEPNIKWMASDDNRSDFRHEHLDWSDKLQSYRQGTYYRKYPDYTYTMISKPITSGDEVYYPVVLDNSSNYNEESAVQSNCVKTYVGRAGSIIVSLRKGGVNSEERATIEYNMTKSLMNENIHINRTQSLGRFNKGLSEIWNEVLLKLDERMLYYINEKEFDTVKIKKVLKSGLELESSSNWGTSGRLVWDKKEINDNSGW
jgi:hypothetical protein